MYPQSVIQRFLSKVPDRPLGKCWVWRGNTDSFGYGILKVGQKSLRAHRISYVNSIGLIPEWATVIRHCCDNPPCVNPAHLLPGTQKDNAADRMARGREGRHHGERNGRFVIAESQIADLRKRAAKGETQASLARQFGVTRQAVWRIVHRRTWSHVEGDV